MLHRSPSRPHPRPRAARRLVAGLALAALLLTAACADDGGGRGGVVGGSGPGTTSTRAFLTTTADDIIIPSYRALVANLDHLDGALAQLCTTPAADGLDAARAAWRDTALAWQSTRPTDVGPAIDRRLMSSVGFKARPDEVEALVGGTAPLDPTALAAQGSGVRGIYAVEVALFAPTSSALTGAGGARRCTYARSAVQLARTAAQQVLDDWTGAPAYRATFVAGMDGNPQSSVEAVVNELTFRLQEVDDQGLRSIVEATSYDDLPTSREEGPAAYGLAQLRAVLDGVVATAQGPVDGPGLHDLVAGRSTDVGEQLDRLAGAAEDALRGLPDSTAAAFGARARVTAAQAAVHRLRVLVSTTVASQLGVTIGFSDADGDS